MPSPQTNLNCIARRVKEAMKVARTVPESEASVLCRITEGLQDELLNASTTMDEPGVRVPRILLSLRRLFNDDQVWDQPSKAQLVTVSSEDPYIKTCPEYIDMETDDESVGPDPWWTQDIEIEEAKSETNNSPSKGSLVREKRKRKTVLSRPTVIEDSDESDESDVQPKKPKRRHIKSQPKAQQENAKSNAQDERRTAVKNEVNVDKGKGRSEVVKVKAKSNTQEGSRTTVKNEVNVDKGKGRSEAVGPICKNCAARSLSCVWPTAWSIKKPNERRACNSCSLNKIKCEVEGHEPLRRPRRKVILEVDASSSSANPKDRSKPRPSDSKVDVQASSGLNGAEVELFVKKMDRLRKRLKDDTEELSNRITSLEVEFTGVLKRLANQHHLPDSK